VKEAVSYDDVLLVPKYSEIESRSQIDIGSDLDNNLRFDLPVISSPMDTVTEDKMALAMDKYGGLGLIHRYNSIEDQVAIAALACFKDDNARVGAAIGMTGDFEERALALRSVGVKVLCVDVAHGHHIMMERCLKTLKDRFGDEIHIMAGNVATLEGFDALASWGADSIRVGIGGGSICSTRLISGHGVPTLASVIECAKSSYDVKIIADGGVKTSGDIIKSLAAGADFVMIGSLLAGTEETPGETYQNNTGKKYKVYRGMASADAQNSWRGKTSTPEGISTTVPYKGSVDDVLKNLAGGIRSGFSYTGVRSMRELQSKATFIRQTTAGQSESFTHILRRS
jgi:IMP dehydrogenase